VCLFSFGYALRIRAYGSGFGQGLASGTRFGFRYAVRLREFVWTFGEALGMRECAIVLESCSFRESREKSGSTVRSAGKSQKPGDGKVFVSFISPRVMMAEGETHGE